MATKVFCDAAELQKAILDTDLTISAAARKANLCDRQIARLLAGNRRVQVKTAGRLQRAFGDRVVRLIPAAAQV